MGAFFVNFSDDSFKAGGLRDNFRAKITDYAFTTDGPANYGAQSIFLQLALEFQENDVVIQDDQFFYSMGGKALDVLMPSEDGYGLVLNPNNPNGATDVSGVKLIEKTKFDLFRRALLKCGFPQSCLVGSPTNVTPWKSIVGMECHWIQEAVADRGIKDQSGQQQQQQRRAELVLVPNKIYVLSQQAQIAAGPGAGVVGGGAGVAGAVAGGRRRGPAPAAQAQAQTQPAAAAPEAAVATPAPAAAPAPVAGGARRGRPPAAAGTGTAFPPAQPQTAAPTSVPAAQGPTGVPTPYAQCTPDVQAQVVAYYTKIANDDNQVAGTFAANLVSSVPSPAVRGVIKTMHPAGGNFYTDHDGEQLAAIGFQLYDDGTGTGGVVVGYLEQPQ